MQKKTFFLSVLCVQNVFCISILVAVCLVYSVRSDHHSASDLEPGRGPDLDERFVFTRQVFDPLIFIVLSVVSR